MKLKYYVTVPNIREAIDHWKTFFDVTEIKSPEEQKHCYVKLFDQISIHMWEKEEIREHSLHIIRFENTEAELYRKTVEKVLKAEGIEIVREEQEYFWGTTILRFKDEFKFFWAIEINTEALK